VFLFDLHFQVGQDEGSLHTLLRSEPFSISAFHSKVIPQICLDSWQTLYLSVFSLEKALSRAQHSKTVRSFLINIQGLRRK